MFIHVHDNVRTWWRLLVLCTLFSQMLFTSLICNLRLFMHVWGKNKKVNTNLRPKAEQSRLAYTRSESTPYTGRMSGTAGYGSRSVQWCPLVYYFHHWCPPWHSCCASYNICRHKYCWNKYSAAMGLCRVNYRRVAVVKLNPQHSLQSPC